MAMRMAQGCGSGYSWAITILQKLEFNVALNYLHVVPLQIIQGKQHASYCWTDIEDLGLVVTLYIWPTCGCSP
jgi:hypothetical protein